MILGVGAGMDVRGRRGSGGVMELFGILGGGGGTNACVRVKNHRTVCYKGVNSIACIACKLHSMQMMPGRGNSICKGPEV